MAKKRKPMLKRGDQVQFLGRRWFESSYGNTYHSATVAVLPKGSDRWIEVGSSGIHYGYGNQYEQTGREILEAAYSMPRGWGKDRRRPLWKLQDYGVQFLSSVRDVKRERDL